MLLLLCVAYFRPGVRIVDCGLQVEIETVPAQVAFSIPAARGRQAAVADFKPDAQRELLVILVITLQLILVVLSEAVKSLVVGNCTEE